MIDRNALIKIRNDLLFEKIDDNTGYLIGEQESYCFSSAFHLSFFSQLTVDITVSSLISNLNKSYPEAYILFEIMDMKQKGYVTIEDESSRKIAKQDFCPSVFSSKHNFELFGTDRNSINAFSRLSENLTKANNFLNLITCHSYLEESFLKIISEVVKTGKRCIPVKLNGSKIWIGPVFNNGAFCPYCMEYVLLQNQPVVNYIKKIKGKVPVILNALDINELLYRAELALKYIDLAIVMSDSIITINPENCKNSVHVIRPIPQCPKCGDFSIFEKQILQPLTINSIPGKFTKEGGFRSAIPEDTWRRLEHLVDPVTGIVSYIGPHEEKNHQLRPVWRTTYFVNPHPIHVTKGELFVRNGFGKGNTANQSRASALCETIERHSAQFTGTEPVIKGTIAELSERNPVSPDKLFHFSNDQYSNRTVSNTNPRQQKIPPAFNDKIPINWTYSWSLTQKKTKLLPLTFCYIFAPYTEEECFFPFCSNGNAAGNTIEEAILQGLMELIERDAVAIWWYNRIQRPGVDLNSFSDPYFQKVESHYNECGYDIWVLDLTHDLEIPVVAALARHKQTRNYFIGLGAHLDMHLAVQRAITEMHQVFTQEKDNNSGLWCEKEIEDPSYLLPIDIVKPDIDNYKVFQNTSICDDVNHCVNKLSDNDLETIVLNYTRPDINFPTVKVVVPGLRHFWRRLGKGRLYDIPVKLGWLEAAKEENEMNPVSLCM